MADIASVLDAASALGAHVGSQDGTPVGQAARPGGAFFAVLASRMGPVAKAEAKGDADVLMLVKGGKVDAPLAGVDLLAAAPIVDPDASEPESPLAGQLSADQVILPGLSGDLARQSIGPAGSAPGLAVATTQASVSEEDAVFEVSPESPRPSVRKLAGETRVAASPFPLAGGQSNSTANAAEDPGAKGQLLPPGASGRSAAEQAIAPLADMPKAGAGEALTPLSVTAAASGVANPAGADIPFSRAFEHALRPPEPRLNVSVDAPVKSSAFAGELGEKIVWLTGRQGQIAEISLNPPHMGTLEVRLTVSGGEAGAQFFSVNPAVRDAIEAALPRLRELMAQAGITLGEAQVRDEAFMQGNHPDGPDRSFSGMAGESDVGGDMRGMGPIRARGVGLIDLYV